VLRQYTDMVITTEWFSWGMSGDQPDTFEGCTKLEDMAKIPDIDKVLSQESINISGVNITGFHYDESGPVSQIIYVGKDKTGEVFRKELKEAITVPVKMKK
jgi:hypothetical protein